MSSPPARAPRLHLAADSAGRTPPDARRRALEWAVDCAARAPSVGSTEPWRFELSPDRLVIRADRTRQLTTLDPIGRELVQSVGAALFNARVALAARGWAAEIDRLPVQGDPDVLAVVRPVPGPPDAGLAGLLPAAHRRRTNRRRFAGGHVPDEVVRRLTDIAERDGVLLVPVAHESHRRLVARLTRQADRLQNADPAYRAERRTWATRACGEGNGVPAAAVAPVDRGQHEKVPLSGVDARGDGAPAPDIRSDAGQTIALLATRNDDPLAWLRAGEALQHVLLELTRLDWVAEPLTQAVEVPFTRIQLRAALTWDAHPQMLLRIGRAPSIVPTSRPRPGNVLVEAPRPSGSLPVQRPPVSPGRPDRPVR
jgi:hypothetical protein